MVSDYFLFYYKLYLIFLQHITLSLASLKKYQYENKERQSYNLPDFQYGGAILSVIHRQSPERCRKVERKTPFISFILNEKRERKKASANRYFN